MSRHVLFRVGLALTLGLIVCGLLVSGSRPAAARLAGSRVPGAAPNGGFTPTPTATPCPGDVIQNGGFETGSLSPDWVALVSNPAWTVGTPAHNGSFAAQWTAGFGSGSIYQQISVPAAGGTLSFWYLPPPFGSGQFNAYLTDTSNTVLATILTIGTVPSPVWTQQTFNLAAFAGQTVRLQLSAQSNDGYTFSVDDVSIPFCPAATATATVTVTPTNSSTATATATASATATVPPANTATATVPPTGTQSPSVTPTAPAPPATPSPTAPASATALATSTASPTAPPAATASPSAPPTSPTATVTNCPLPFTDVPVEYYAFGYIKWAYCRGIISGYSDGTFQPEAAVTRGQTAKILLLAAGKPMEIGAGAPHFSDVPPTNVFYGYIETAYTEGIISGYSDGTYRPSVPVTRGQIAKIVVRARGLVLLTPATPTFADVAADNVFYGAIETALAHGIIVGYDCGGPGEPCDSTQRPYYRPAALATRAQLCKMAYQAFGVPGLR